MQSLGICEDTGLTALPPNPPDILSLLVWVCTLPPTNALSPASQILLFLYSLALLSPLMNPSQATLASAQQGCSGLPGTG